MEKIPYTSLVEGLRNRAQDAPEKQVLTVLSKDGSAQHATYSRLHSDAVRYGKALQALDIGPDDLVLLVFPHSYEVVPAFFGALYAGSIPGLFYYVAPRSTPEIYKNRIKKLVLFAEAKAVVTTSELTEDLTQLLADTQCKILNIHTIPETEEGTDALHGLRPSSGDAAAYVQFSSGTTGSPKGVVLSHKAVLDNNFSVYDYLHFNKDDVFVNWLPLSHDLGLVFHLIMPLMMGASSVIMSPMRWVRSPKILLQAHHTYKGTVSMMPNFAFNHCVRGIKERDLTGLDLSSWRLLGNAAEPVDYESMQLFSERFEPYGFNPKALMVAYGLAENVVGVSGTHTGDGDNLVGDWVSVQALQTEHRAVPAPPQSTDARCVVGCGWPIECTLIAIVDEDGNRLPDRQVGEVMLGGSSIFSGYYGQPALTAQTIRDGWFFTGDIGYLVDGQLFICDRKKDLIIVGGKNVYPSYIETIAKTALGDNAGLTVAFGLHDDDLGTEIPIVVCELRRRLSETDEEQIAYQIRQQVAEELDVALADLRFVKRGWVLRTTSGKVARSKNRQKYLDEGYRPISLQEAKDMISGGDLQDVAAMPMKQRRTFLLDFVSSKVAAILGVHPVTSIDIRQGFAELGMTSLQAVELRKHLEIGLGCSLPTTVAFDYPTIDAFVTYLLNDVFSRQTTPPPEKLSKSPIDKDLTGFLEEINQMSDTDVTQQLLEN